MQAPRAVPGATRRDDASPAFARDRARAAGPRHHPGGRRAVRQEAKQRRGEGGQSRGRAARAAAGRARGGGRRARDEVSPTLAGASPWARRHGDGGDDVRAGGLEARRARPGGPGGRARRKGPFVDPLQELLDAGIPGPGFGRLPARTRPASSGLCGASAAERGGGSGRRRSRRRGTRARRGAPGLGIETRTMRMWWWRTSTWSARNREPRRAAPAPARRRPGCDARRARKTERDANPPRPPRPSTSSRRRTWTLLWPEGTRARGGATR